MRPHRWERVLSHQGTRRTDTKHQECCATITQILPPAFPEPHGCACPAPASSGDAGTRVIPDCQGLMMLSCSLPNDCVVAAPCDMVVEK